MNTASTLLKPHNTKKEKISLLLVDDDEVDRANILRVLSKSQQSHYKISIAKGFEEANSLLDKKRFDICLIDYYLSGYTGLELLDKVKRSNPEASVIILTGRDDQIIDNESLKAGVSDFLNKNGIDTIILDRSIRYAIHHKKMTVEHEYLANFDPLTKLVNRNLFFNRLTHLTNQSHRYGRRHAVLYIDLDFFKKINDDYGHDVGDSVLQIFASRLLENIRTTDTAARLGGDEFAIILEEINSEDAHLVSQKILEEIKNPFVIKHLSINVSTSIGMTFFPHYDDQDPSAILKQADQALYYAKKSGRKQYRNYDNALKKSHEDSVLLETDLHLAIRSTQIFPYYQPQYCMKTNKVIGFEALARWNHPRNGFIPPNVFIPCAEKLSLISLLTESIMKQVGTDMLSFIKADPALKVAINISGTECSNPHILHLVKLLIQENHIQPQQIELEVTESVLIKHPESSIEVLTSLHDLGVTIAIDDFGTGYSSLSYLTELPIDVLKIDMSFVQGIGVNSQKEVVVQVIIDLAKRLGLKVVAEGVETQAQADFLATNGCDYGQGYLYSKPCTFLDCKALLNTT